MLFSLVVLVGCQLINAVAGLTLQAVVLLNLLVPLQGWDARFGFVNLRNAVAGLGLKGTMLFGCWHLNLLMLLQC